MYTRTYTFRQKKEKEEKERDREGKKMCVCVCVCIYEKKKEKETSHVYIYDIHIIYIIYILYIIYIYIIVSIPCRLYMRAHTYTSYITYARILSLSFLHILIRHHEYLIIMSGVTSESPPSDSSRAEFHR